MKDSKLVTFIRSHEQREQQMRRSRTAELLGKIRHTPLLLRLAGASRASELEKKVSFYFVGASAKAYGSFLLAFGLVTLLSHFARYYLEPEVIDVLVPLIIGAISSIASIPLFLTEKPIYEATEENPVLAAIFYDFFCLKHSYARGEDAPVFRRRFAVPLAILLGALGFFTSTLHVALSLLGLWLVWLSLTAPEIPFLLSLLALPYLSLLPHGTIVLCALVLLATLSYIRKAAIGNRNFTLQSYDILLGFFAVVYLISGIFNGEIASLGAALVRIILLSGFTLAANLIVNRRIADNVALAIGLCSAPVSLIGIYQYFFTDLSDPYSDPMFAGLIRGRITGTFQNPNVFAMFLCVATVFALYHFQGAHRLGNRIVSGIILGLHLLATVLTFSRGAWIALMLGIGLVLLLEYVRTPGFLLTLLVGLTAGSLLLPDAVMARLFSIVNASDTSIRYRLSIFRSSIEMLKENLLVGIGVGEDTFRIAFMQYAEDGVIAPHSHNLFLQLGCEAGVLAIIVFLLLLIFRARHVTSYRRYTKESSVRRINRTCIGVIFSLLLFGMTDAIFYPHDIFYLFFIVFGIGSAVLHIAKREHDDRRAYYGDDQSPEASSVEISFIQD